MAKQSQKANKGKYVHKGKTSAKRKPRVKKHSKKIIIVMHIQQL